MNFSRLTTAAVFCLVAVAASAQATQDLAEARALVAAEQFTAAEARLRALSPQSADSYFLLGYVLFREHKAADSLAAYTAGAKLRTPAPDDVLVVASDYVLLRDYSDAERWLKYVTERAPGSAEAWYLLGRARYNLDHAQDAADAFLACLRLQPRDMKAEYNLGLSYEKLGRIDNAVAAYKQAIAWEKAGSERDPQPYLDLGTLLLARQRPSEALVYLREAAVAGPGNALVEQQLGLALEATGDLAGAVAPLSRAVALAPNAERPHFFLGRVYRKLGREKEAAAEFAAVARLTGTHSETRTPNGEQGPEK